MHFFLKIRFVPLWLSWLERSAVNRKVGGSSPPRGDYYKRRAVSSMEERLTTNQEVVGSTPMQPLLVNKC